MNEIPYIIGQCIARGDSERETLYYIMKHLYDLKEISKEQFLHYSK